MSGKMTRKEAAQTLVELLALYKDIKKCGIDIRFYEAVTLACGVLMVDDVLKSNPLPPEDN